MVQLAQVRPHLFFGSAPRGTEDIEVLSGHGISAVLCLETDEDIAEHELEWSLLEHWYAARGIIARRVPIVDFSPAAIVSRLDEALTALAAMLGEGRTVYVHCSEGLSRSPTIVIAHLVRVEGLPLAEALEVVSAARPSIQPYPQALEAIRQR